MKFSMINGSIFLGAHIILVFMAYKLLSAARRYEEFVQRANNPMIPGLPQQPMMAFAPGYYPANIPMGAPVQQ